MHLLFHCSLNEDLIKSLFTKMNDKIRYLEIKTLMIKFVFFLILILIRTSASLLLPSCSKHLRDEGIIIILIIINKLSHSIISPLQYSSYYYCICTGNTMLKKSKRVILNKLVVVVFFVALYFLYLSIFKCNIL